MWVGGLAPCGACQRQSEMAVSKLPARFLHRCTTGKLSCHPARNSDLNGCKTSLWRTDQAITSPGRSQGRRYKHSKFVRIEATKSSHGPSIGRESSCDVTVQGRRITRIRALCRKEYAPGIRGPAEWQCAITMDFQVDCGRGRDIPHEEVSFAMDDARIRYGLSVGRPNGGTVIFCVARQWRVSIVRKIRSRVARCQQYCYGENEQRSHESTREARSGLASRARRLQWTGRATRITPVRRQCRTTLP